MTGSLTWAHIGDLHADDADGFGSLAVLDAIIAELNGSVGDVVDFVFLPATMPITAPVSSTSTCCGRCKSFGYPGV